MSSHVQFCECLDSKYCKEEVRQLRKALEEAKKKAALWDALMSADRIRILGHAEIDGPHPHFGMEIWLDCPDKDSENGKDIITRFCQTKVKRES
jgi:hypothetical protein